MDTGKNKIRFFAEIAMSAITVIVAVLFIIAVTCIYFAPHDGDIYSREIVWGWLKWLIAPVVIWALAIIACYVLAEVFPEGKKTKKAAGPIVRVRNLRSRVPSGEGSAEFNAARKKYQGFEIGRIVMFGAATAFALGSAIAVIVYLADGAHFASGEINEDVLGFGKVALPLALASFVMFFLSMMYELLTAEAELGSITTMLKEGKGMPITRSALANNLEKAKAAVNKHSKLLVWVARGVVFVLAAVFIGLGVADGGANDVLVKAIAICTECIGLG